MVDKRAAALDRVFRALASEPRREILRRVAGERCTVTELAQDFDMSLAAVSKHVRVLETANLIAPSREGRLHWCRLNPDALEPARASIEELEAFWNGQLDGLESLLTAQAGQGPDARGRRRRGRS
jgi:DNA-binding transcriptional ArsR family regulator